MENLALAFNVVMPLFLMMALGYCIRLLKLGDEATFKKMNNIVFRVFLPILLFHNVISTDLSTAFNGPLLLTAVCFVIAEFALCMIFVPLLEKENRRRGVLVQGIMRSRISFPAASSSACRCWSPSAGRTATRARCPW